jgi:hypothetical protein
MEILKWELYHGALTTTLSWGSDGNKIGQKEKMVKLVVSKEATVKLRWPCRDCPNWDNGSIICCPRKFLSLNTGCSILGWGSSAWLRDHAWRKTQLWTFSSLPPRRWRNECLNPEGKSGWSSSASMEVMWYKCCCRKLDAKTHKKRVQGGRVKLFFFSL